MTSPELSSASNPNDALAERVITALKEKGLLPEKHVSQAELKLQTGRASGSDWQLWAEGLIVAEEKADAKANSD